MYVTNVAILWFGGQMIMAGRLGVGELTGFMSYVLLIMNSLMMISGVFLLTARAITSVRRIGEILSEEPAIESPEHGLTDVKNGAVRFENVSFKYSQSAEEDVLEDINLSFAPGSTVGILGGTGSGKTTLIQLIARLYDATEGTVFVGENDVRSYNLVSLRDAVSVVLQKNVLFSGTSATTCSGAIPMQLMRSCFTPALLHVLMSFLTGLAAWTETLVRVASMSLAVRSSVFVLRVRF